MSELNTQSQGDNPPNPKEAEVGVYLGIVLLLLVPVIYVVVAVISIAVLNYKAPVSADDLQYSSWLITPPYMSALAAGLGTGLAIFGVIRCLVGSAFGLFLIAISVALLSGTFPSTSFRSAVLAGDAKVGCYDYSSQACLKMLGLPARHDSGDRSSEAGARKQALPIEISTFIRAPFDVLKADQLNQMLDAQRQDLKKQLDAYAE